MNKGFVQLKKTIYSVKVLFIVATMIMSIFTIGQTNVFAEDQQTIDLASRDGWITSINVYKKENNKWVENPSEWKDNDGAKIAISYQVPENSVKGEGTVLNYQLPAGVVVSDEQSGDVTDPADASKVLGQYVVTTGGLIQITLNKNYDRTTKYTGNVTFEGSIDKSKAGDGGKINFPGSSTSITIKDTPSESTTDLRMSKEGKLSDDRKSIQYTIKASTNKGTASTVDLKDEISWFKGVIPEYDTGSLRLVKTDKKGKEIEQINLREYNPTFSHKQWEPQKATFEIKGLPKLEAGQSYVLTYKMNLNDDTSTPSNGEVDVGNSITGTSGKDSNSDYKTYSSSTMIEKGGSLFYDEINWNVLINRDKRDITKYQFTDTLPSGYTLKDGIKVYYLDDKNNDHPVEVKDLETAQAGSDHMSIDFSKIDLSLKNKVFKITYKTNAPDVNEGDDPVTVSNTGHLHGDGHSYESKGNVIVSPPDISIKKDKAGDPTFNGNKAIYNWNVQIGLTGKPITGFTYKDVISDAKDKNDTNQDLGSGSHYATAKNLYETFDHSDVLKITKANDDGSATTYKVGEDYTWSLTCYDADHNKVNNDNDSTPVKSYELKIMAYHKEKFKPTNFQFSYQTYGDLSSLTKGRTYQFKNTGYIIEHNGETVSNKDNSGEYEYKYERSLEKLASKDGSATSYSSDHLTIDYPNLKDGNIFYRLMLKLDPNQKGDITVTDVLPKGMSYVEGSMNVRFYKSDYDLAKSNYNWQVRKKYGFSERHYDFGVDQPSIDVKEQKDGTLLTFHIKDGYEADQEQRIAIDYLANVSNDSDWKNMTITNKDYTNSASWGDTTSQQTTTIKRPVKVVNKGVKQLTDKNGKLTNKLEYSVDLNPGGLDLDPNNDLVTLNDQLKVDDGVKAYLDLENVHLYKYDSNKTDHRGAEIAPSTYSLTYNENTHQITMEFPDQMPCVFVYQYTIDKGNNDTAKVSNEANINGKNDDSSYKTFQSEKASATLSGSKVTITKVDAENNSILLKGAEFSIAKRDTENKKWVSLTPQDVSSMSRLITGSDGKISLTRLTKGILYRVTEKQAPDGYKKLDHPYYLMIPKGNDISATALDKIYNDLDDGLKKDPNFNKTDIHLYSETGGNLLVTNDYNRLTVKKNWLNKDGTIGKAGANSVNMTLYRYKKGTKFVKMTLNLIDPNGKTETKTFIVDQGTTFTVYWDKKDTTMQSVQVNNGKEMKEYKNKRTYTSDKIQSDTTINVKTKKKKKNAHFTYTYSKEKVEDFTLSSSVNEKDNWSKTWDTLDPQYVYEVVETPVSGYETTYMNNDVSKGTINVNNKSTSDSPMLPSTGGRGTKLLYVLGGLFMCIGVILVMIKRRVVKP